MSWDYDTTQRHYIDVYNTTTTRGYQQITPSASRNDFSTSTLRFQNGLIGPGLNRVFYQNYSGTPMQYNNTVLRRRWLAVSGCSACQGLEADYTDSNYNWICRLTFSPEGGGYARLTSPQHVVIDDAGNSGYPSIEVSAYILKQNWVLQDDGETSMDLYSGYDYDDIDVSLHRSEFSEYLSSCRGFSDTWVTGDSRTDIRTTAQKNDKGWMIWLYLSANAKGEYDSSRRQYTFKYNYMSRKNQRRFGILCSGGDNAITYALANQAAQRIQSNVQAATNSGWFNQDKTWSELMDMITAGTWISNDNKGFGINAPKLWIEYTGNLDDVQNEWRGTDEESAYYESGQYYPKTDETAYIGNNYTNLLSYRRRDGLRKVGTTGQRWFNAKCDYSSWMNFSACCSNEWMFGSFANGRTGNENYTLDLEAVSESGREIYEGVEEDILWGTGNWPIGGGANYASSCTYMSYGSDWNNWCMDYKGWYGYGNYIGNESLVTDYHQIDEDYFNCWWKWNSGCYFNPGGLFTIDFKVKVGIIAYYPEVVRYIYDYPSTYVGVSPS